MLLLFVASILLVLWAYLGYPLSMSLLSRVIKREVKFSSGYEPPVSIILAVANEEKHILEKMANLTSLDYPADKVEIIVSLDGSTDKTAHYVSLIANVEPYSTIRVLENEKGGKESAQLAAVRAASNPILVFTDVATELKPNALRKIVRWFADPSIGGVDGMSKIKSTDHSNEGLYLRYENKIREWESATSGLVTFGGCLFAARASMLKASSPIAGFVSDLQSDFRTALVTRAHGYRSVLDTEAVALFEDGEEAKEFGRKHRTIVRGLNNLFHHLFLLNPMKYGLFSYALFNHKVMKWLVPLFMIAALVSNIVLAFNDNVFFDLALTGQLIFYSFAFSPWNNKWIKIIKFFVITNLAILNAWWSYMNGERFVTWTPTVRK